MENFKPKSNTQEETAKQIADLESQQAEAEAMYDSVEVGRLEQQIQELKSKVESLATEAVTTPEYQINAVVEQGGSVAELESRTAGVDAEIQETVQEFNEKAEKVEEVQITVEGEVEDGGDVQKSERVQKLEADILGKQERVKFLKESIDRSSANNPGPIMLAGIEANYNEIAQLESSIKKNQQEVATFDTRKTEALSAITQAENKKMQLLEAYAQAEQEHKEVVKRVRDENRSGYREQEESKLKEAHTKLKTLNYEIGRVNDEIHHLNSVHEQNFK